MSARHVIHNTAENFAELSLELGGKSPFIVFDDANIESAVNGSVAGIFGASGQSCVAGSRLYLHDDIADEFLERMAKIAASEKSITGPRFAAAPMTTKMQKMTLNTSSLVSPSPNRNVHALSP